MARVNETAVEVLRVALEHGGWHTVRDFAERMGLEPSARNRARIRRAVLHLTRQGVLEQGLTSGPAEWRLALATDSYSHAARKILRLVLGCGATQTA